jgi:hypothetical protein
MPYNTEMVMVGTKELSDQVLSFFKDKKRFHEEGPPDEYHIQMAEEYESYVKSLNIIERYFHEFSQNYEYSEDQVNLAIEIINSNIIIDGKLKGRNISGIYKTYEITDFLGFISEASTILNKVIYIKGYIQCVNKQFESMIAKYDELSKIMLEYKGVRPKTVNNIRSNLIDIQDNTLSKMTPKIKLSKDIIPLLINLFKKHIPGAPDERIAICIRELLKIVSSEEFIVTEGAIRKQIQLLSKTPPSP